MNNFFKEYFGFSPSESRGFVLLGVVILAAISVPFVMDGYSDQKPEDVKVTLNPIKIEKQKYEKYNYEKYDKFEKYKETKSIANYKLVNFNPNDATAEQFIALGIDKFLAERIVKYRDKGGKYRKKEDLSKIYGLKSEKYEELEPYILLPSLEAQKLETPQIEMTSNAGSNVASANSKAFSTTEHPVRTSFKNPTKFDINTADTTAFKQLPGVGSGYAKRILKFREALGGFTGVQQISETFGLPPEILDEVNKFGFYKTEPKKLNINLATIEQLDAHPYINKFQAKTIVAYRTEHGNFLNIDDLKKIKTLDDNFFQKMSIYFSF